jgi:WD40 repeat protein
MFFRTTKSATVLLLIFGAETGLGTPPTSAELPSSNPPRRDLYGDPLPEGAIARLGTVRLYHRGPARLPFRSPVSGLLYSPDGKTVFAGGVTETIRGWDVDSGKEVRQFVVPQEEMPAGHWLVATSLVLSSDGKTLAAATFHGPRDAGGGSPPDQQGLIYLWDFVSGKLLRRCQGEPGSSLAFSRDGKVLASCGGNPGQVRLWDIATGKELRRLSVAGPGVYSIAFSPTGDALAVVSRDSTIFMLDAATGDVLHRLKGHVNVVMGVAFSRDGKTLASIEAGRPERDPEFYVRIWSVEDGQLLRRLGHERWVWAVAFGADGMLAALADDGIHFWDSRSGKELRRTNGPAASSTAASSLAFAPDGKTVAYGSGDGVISFWDVGTATQVRRMPRHHGSLHAVAASPDGRTAATAGDDHSIMLWDVASAKELRTLTGHNKSVRFVAFSPTGKLLASASLDDDSGVSLDDVFLWDVATGEIVQRLRGRCFAFSPDGKQLAYGGVEESPPRPGFIALHDVEKGKEIRRYHGHKVRVQNIAYSPDGKTLASVSSDRFRVVTAPGLPQEDYALRLWDVVSGRERCRLGGSQVGSSILTFSPDGKLLVTGPGVMGSVGANVWEVATGKTRRVLDVQPRASVDSALFLPDGRTLAVGTARSVIDFLDLATGKQLRELRGHHGSVNGLALSSDQKTLFSAGADMTALVWDLSSVLTPPRTGSTPLLGAALSTLWADLASADAAEADRAIWTLVGAGNEAVAWLDARLLPVRRDPLKRIPQLLADLDNDQFAVREAASKELEELLPDAEERLQTAQRTDPSAEVRRRLGDLLERNTGKTPAPKLLRQMRALEVLEHISTPEAGNVLKKLAAGARQARLTQEAKAAVERLERRPDAKR